MSDRITYPIRNEDLIVFPPGVAGTVAAICRRPALYVKDRESFLSLMWGIVIGHNGGRFHVPGPDFDQFRIDMDQPLTWEWTEPVQRYVFSLLDIDRNDDEMREFLIRQVEDTGRCPFDGVEMELESNHERDSSNDVHRCPKCRWSYGEMETWR